MANNAVSKQAEAITETAPLKKVALIVESAVAPRRMMLTGVARYMQEHEPWSVYLKPFGVEQSLRSWLEHWRGDGIMAAVSDIDLGMISRFGAPVVDLMGRHRHAHIPLVHTDDYAVGRLGAEHLMERGFRQFAFCEYSGWFWSQHRREGFQSTVRAQRLDCFVYSMTLPGPGSGGPESWEAQQGNLAKWVSELPKPVGVMTTNDVMGQQLLEACQRLRLKVPEEIAVIGADDDEPICRIASPPLSSVIINDHQRGYAAAAVLDRMMSGEAPPKEPVNVQPSGVRARASTDIFAIDDSTVVAALRFLRERACGGIRVDDVAKQVHVSRSVLERRFRRAVGRSVNAEMVRVRINRAIELLSETELELKVIAHRAGFGTQSYMNAVFQDKLNCTPGSYRTKANS